MYGSYLGSRYSTEQEVIRRTTECHLSLYHNICLTETGRYQLQNPHPHFPLVSAREAHGRPVDTYVVKNHVLS